MSKTETKGAFRWNAQKAEAAMMVAEDKLSDTKIADKLGVHRATLDRWRREPEFINRVDKHIGEFCALVRRRGIARLENRVDALNDRWRALKNIAEARGADMAGECPGGEEGYQVRQLKFVKTFVPDPKTQEKLDQSLRDGSSEIDIAEELEGEDHTNFIATRITVPVYEYSIDTGLMAELRALEKQAAQELGQWVDRSEVENRDTGALDDLKRRLASLDGAGGAEPVSGESAA